MRRIVGLVAAVFAVQVGCSGQDDCTLASEACGNYPLVVDLTPRALTLSVGDTASAAVTVTQRGRPARATIRWTADLGIPDHAVVVAIDSTTVSQPRTRVRGIVAGSGSVAVSVSVGGQVVTSAVPVTVVTR